MDQEYDAIVLGTGLKECLLAGVLSKEGYKILHLDRNAYYGGDSASLNLKQLWEKFRGEDEEYLKEKYGRWQDYNIDMVPKMMMGNGLLVKLLVHTGVHNYVQFKACDGSYVFRKGKLFKVPATDKDALHSPLMGLLEKMRARSFFQFVQNYEEETRKRTKDTTCVRLRVESCTKNTGWLMKPSNSSGTRWRCIRTNYTWISLQYTW